MSVANLLGRPRFKTSFSLISDVWDLRLFKISVMQMCLRGSHRFWRRRRKKQLNEINQLSKSQLNSDLIWLDVLTNLAIWMVGKSQLGLDSSVQTSFRLNSWQGFKLLLLTNARASDASVSRLSDPRILALQEKSLLKALLKVSGRSPTMDITADSSSGLPPKDPEKWAKSNFD